MDAPEHVTLDQAKLKRLHMMDEWTESLRDTLMSSAIAKHGSSYLTIEDGEPVIYKKTSVTGYNEEEKSRERIVGVIRQHGHAALGANPDLKAEWDLWHAWANANA